MDTRLKIRYSIAETRNNLYTYGGEWQTENGEPYRGLYHQYTTTQETYTEPVWNEKTSKRLVSVKSDNADVIAYNQLNNSIPTKFQSPNNTKPTITATDRASGVITRYILKKTNETQFIEIAASQYNAYVAGLVDQNLYSVVTLQWKITGTTDEIIKFNATSIAAASQIMPSIAQYLTNLTEYREDTDFIVPKNIN
jgi:hypothetical protein